MQILFKYFTNSTQILYSEHKFCEYYTDIVQILQIYYANIVRIFVNIEQKFTHHSLIIIIMEILCKLLVSSYFQ